MNKCSVGQPWRWYKHTVFWYSSPKGRFCQVYFSLIMVKMSLLVQLKYVDVIFKRDETQAAIFMPVFHIIGIFSCANAIEPYIHQSDSYICWYACINLSWWTVSHMPIWSCFNSICTQLDLLLQTSNIIKRLQSFEDLEVLAGKLKMSFILYLELNHGFSTCMCMYFRQ